MGSSELVAKVLRGLGVLAESEISFCPGRKFRLDVAVPSRMIALEIEGGVWSGGRHTRGKGFLRDMEKYNLATLAGWRLFRCTPDTALTDGIEWVLRAYAATEGADADQTGSSQQAPSEPRSHAVKEAAREHGLRDEVEDHGQAKPRVRQRRRRSPDPKPAGD